MLIAVIIAITLIAFDAALMVGFHHEGPQVKIRALNYPITFVHNPDSSWSAQEGWGDDV